jgi:3-oxoacyl-[acyl-carrier-protein] synthase-3
VDAILIVTDSLPTGRAAHDEVRELVTELALTAATPMTLALLDCAAPIVALSAAAAMVAHGRYRTVLVLTGDVAELAAQGSRVVAGGSALASDAASAVLIGSRGPGRAVLGAASDYSHELAVDDLPSHRQLRLRVAAQRRLHGRLRETVGPAWRRPDLVLASNIARRLLLTYLDDVGYREDDIFLDNVAAHGHCLGSDPIINLVDAEVARPGDLDTCLLMGAGVAHSALLLLGGEDDA